MASELYVETLKGLTSGANANKVIIPSGQTLEIDAWSPPAGTVLQAVQSVSDTYEEFSTTSFTDVANLSLAITPSSTSNKILVQVSLPISLIRVSNTRQSSKIKILRDATQIVFSDRAQRIGAGTDYAGENYMTNQMTFLYLDSPSSTSSLTYKVQAAAFTTNDSGRIRINDYDAAGATVNTATITLMEIAG